MSDGSDQIQMGFMCRTVDVLVDLDESGFRDIFHCQRHNRLDPSDDMTRQNDQTAECISGGEHLVPVAVPIFRVAPFGTRRTVVKDNQDKCATSGRNACLRMCVTAVNEMKTGLYWTLSPTLIPAADHRI